MYVPNLYLSFRTRAISHVIRLITDNYRVIALNWTVDVSTSDGKTSMKKKKKSADGNNDSDRPDVFPDHLAQTYSNLIKVYLFVIFTTFRYITRT